MALYPVIKCRQPAHIQNNNYGLGHWSLCTSVLKCGSVGLRLRFNSFWRLEFFVPPFCQEKYILLHINRFCFIWYFRANNWTKVLTNNDDVNNPAFWYCLIGQLLLKFTLPEYTTHSIPNSFMSWWERLRVRSTNQSIFWYFSPQCSFDLLCQLRELWNQLLLSWYFSWLCTLPVCSTMHLNCKGKFPVHHFQ